MRSITITLPDAIAEELEADAHTSGRSLADFAGEKFAVAYNVAASRQPGEGAPNTKWVNGKPVYVPPATPPAWIQESFERNDPLLILLRQWIVEGENATPQEQEAADAELDELKEAMNSEREKAGMRKLFL